MVHLEQPVDNVSMGDESAQPPTERSRHPDERGLMLRFCLDKWDALTALVSAMDDASANWHPDRPGAKSVVALLVHCCGMARRWSSTVNLGVAVPADREDYWTGTCRGVLLHVLEELSQHLGYAAITRDESASR